MKRAKIILLLSISIWCIAIISVPLTKLLIGENILSHFLTSLFAKICHQISERSFSIRSEFLPVCSRCVAIYFSFLIGVILILFIPKIKNILSLNTIIFISFAPIIIDVALEVLGFHASTFYTRVLTGALTGVGLSFLLSNDLTEILENKFFKNKEYSI